MPSDEAKWYVVHTYSGYENKVREDLAITVKNRGFQELITDICLPLEKVTEVGSDGKPKVVERKIFPGYVFVKMVMNDDSWYVVRNIRGCTGFVGPSSKPIPLSDAEVKAMGLDDHSENEDTVKKSVELKYKVGDRVVIKDSSFYGSEGVVESIDLNAKTVRVIVQILDRQTPVELDIFKVEPLE